MPNQQVITNFNNSTDNNSIDNNMSYNNNNNQISHHDDLPKSKSTSSLGSLSDEEEENNNGEFHPIACIQCRSLHKKCDKRLPECSKCSSRGLKCTVSLITFGNQQIVIFKVQYTKKKRKRFRSLSNENRKEKKVN